MIKTAVILAAGRGSRLGRLTESRSKAMLPIVGLPMIQRVLNELTAAGIERVLIVASPKDNELKKYFFGRSQIEVLEQARPLGSGDALKVCAGRVNGNFVVSACDSIIESSSIRSLINTHIENRANVSVGVMEVAADVSLESRSVVLLTARSQISRFIEKPSVSERISNYTALPLYVFNENIFGALSKLKPSVRGEFELPTLIGEICHDPGRLVMATTITDRLDLTSPADLLQLNRLFLKSQLPAVWIDPSVNVDQLAQISAPLWIGPGCKIEAGAQIGPGVVLEADCVIGSGAQIEDAVILRGARIGPTLVRGICLTAGA
jgi:NDP-sugar pyrophosphorylase family protein